MKHPSLEGNVAAIKWPALSFSQGLISLEYSLETHASRLGLRNRFFDGMLLIDSSGRLFRVAEAEKVRLLPPRLKLFVGDLLGVLTGNPRYAIRLRLVEEQPRILSADEIKTMVFEAVRREPSWEAMVDADEFKVELAKSRTVDDIFAIFGRYNH